MYLFCNDGAYCKVAVNKHLHFILVGNISIHHHHHFIHAYLLAARWSNVSSLVRWLSLRLRQHLEHSGKDGRDHSHSRSDGRTRVARRGGAFTSFKLLDACQARFLGSFCIPHHDGSGELCVGVAAYACQAFGEIGVTGALVSYISGHYCLRRFCCHAGNTCRLIRDLARSSCADDGGDEEKGSEKLGHVVKRGLNASHPSTDQGRADTWARRSNTVSEGGKREVTYIMHGQSISSSNSYSIRSHHHRHKERQTWGNHRPTKVLRTWFASAKNSEIDLQIQKSFSFLDLQRLSVQRLDWLDYYVLFRKLPNHQQSPPRHPKSNQGGQPSRTSKGEPIHLKN